MKYFYYNLEEFNADASREGITIVNGPEGKIKRWLSALVLDNGVTKSVLIRR